MHIFVRRLTTLAKFVKDADAIVNKWTFSSPKYHIVHILDIFRLPLIFSMVDLVSVSLGYGFGILGVVGIICVDSILRMFRGDVMEQLFKFMVAGFAIVTVVGFGDAVLYTVGQTVPLGVLAAALMVSFALLLIGLVRLIQWNERSKLTSVAG